VKLAGSSLSAHIGLGSSRLPTTRKVGVTCNIDDQSVKEEGQRMGT
jgi:hypothetical protein